MYRALLRIIAVASLASLAAVGTKWWYSSTSDQRMIAKLEEQKRELEQKRNELQQIVTRLGTEKRVADVIVVDRTGEGATAKSTLLFVEYDRAGKPLPPRQFTIYGTMAHVDAMVIEFDRDFVVQNDPLRGHSIALFTRIFGDQQAPASAARIDAPGRVPAFYRDSTRELTAFEEKLWEQFWQLESDESLRKETGVRVAIGKSVWGPFEPDLLYTLTLTPDGNLSRTAEPIRGVYATYIQMMRDKVVATE